MDSFKLHGRQGIDLASFQPKALDAFSRITLDNIQRMGSFYDELHSRSGPIKRSIILKGDSRNLLNIDPTVLNEGKARIVITSPPYGDSHTTVAYGQFSRYSSLWLGLPLEEVLSVDSRGLGGRILNKMSKFESPTLESVLADISRVDEKRAREVSTFFHDADICLEQITRAMKKGLSHCCYVVANRTVRRVKVPTDQIFVELGSKFGLQHLVTIHREIPNKYIPHKNAPENIAGKLGSTMTEESIIVWKY